MFKELTYVYILAASIFKEALFSIVTTVRTSLPERRKLTTSYEVTSCYKCTRRQVVTSCRYILTLL